jgi:hypothetical protein
VYGGTGVGLSSISKGVPHLTNMRMVCFMLADVVGFIQANKTVPIV